MDASTKSEHYVYRVRPRKDHRVVDLISDALPFGRLWYGEPNAISNAVDYAKFRSRSHRAVICVYDEASYVIENQLEKAGDGVDEKSQDDGVEAKREHALHQG